MWPDKEAEIDYLNFGYMVDMVVDIATNRDLSPSTIGLYGDWGSGKSSLGSVVILGGLIFANSPLCIHIS